ncbi:MAG: TPM domain-containing protein, partial [Dissulfurimicrobium sp.]
MTLSRRKALHFIAAQRLLLCLFALFALLLSAAAYAQGLQPIPELSARVTDLTGTLSNIQKTELESKLAKLEEKKGSQIAILMVPTTKPEDIASFSIRVAEAWQLGRKGVDDGVLILVAKNDRRARIEVGYGLEGTIPDAVAKRIISEIMAPRFKDGDYYGGLSAAVDALAGFIEGEPLPVPNMQKTPATAQTGAAGFWQTLVLIIPFMIILGIVTARILGRILGGLIGFFVATMAV